MGSPDYKGPGRRETARRVRERSDSVNPARGLDEALDDRIEREKERERWMDTMPVLAGVLRSPGPPRCCVHQLAEPDELRQTEWGVLVRHGDHYTLCEALKVPGPSSGGNQGRGPDRSPTERGSEGA